MTQQDFNGLMDTYIKDLQSREPSNWSQDARLWAESKGIVIGDNNNNKAYKSFATREQVAAFIYRTIQYLKTGDNTGKTSLLSASDVELANLSEQLRGMHSSLSNFQQGQDAELSPQIEKLEDTMASLYDQLNGKLEANTKVIIDKTNSVLENLTTAINSETMTSGTINELKDMKNEMTQLLERLKNANKE